jgi:flagella basal body P-ring formation protein FlgA
MEVEAPQTVKTVDRGQPVDMACCRLVRQRLSQLPNRALTSSDMGLTLRAKRNLAVGEFLSWADVGRDMLVQRGQTVRMVLESISGMRISTTGQARGNGSLGDMVEVVNVSSGKTIQGIVAGAQLVKVPF